MDKRNVYLDNAATTKPYDEVLTAMNECYMHNYFNPSSIYQGGADAYTIINDCKKRLLNVIGAEDGDIIITSGGSEADNLAVKGVASYFEQGHIITTAIEHKAILNTCKYLEKVGFKVTYLQPDERGVITPSQVEKAMRGDTILVSIMAANNEIGTIEPIEAIGLVCEKYEVLFHVDAVQALGHMPVNVKKWKADMISVSGHKFHGPKGVGFLYVNNMAKERLLPIIHGGKQEYGLRGGTENLPGIVGMTIAAEKSTEDIMQKIGDMEEVRDYMIEKIFEEISNTKLNGSLLTRLCNNVNITIKGIMAEQAVIMLDMYGIMCSNGSACNSGTPNPSHVLTAIGLSTDDAVGTLRFSLSEETTKEDVDYVVNVLKQSAADLRRLT